MKHPLALVVFVPANVSIHGLSSGQVRPKLVEGAGVTLILDVLPIASLSVKVNDLLLDIPLVDVILMDDVNDVLVSF